MLFPVSCGEVEGDFVAMAIRLARRKDSRIFDDSRDAEFSQVVTMVWGDFAGDFWRNQGFLYVEASWIKRFNNIQKFVVLRGKIVCVFWSFLRRGSD